MLNKKILLGITGGIAAYKSATLVRLLHKKNSEVQVVMTKSAQEFITPLTMSTLSGNSVHTNLFNQELETKIEHIALSNWADIILVAPATANFIAKLANGICDDLLSTLCLAANKDIPIVIAPAMNKEMWHSEATKENIKVLKRRGVLILGPDKGEQACGISGVGRMVEPDTIVETLENKFISKILSNQKILITAGPTLEPIDAVRYIGNSSSGKMGYAIAEAAASAGASVTLISGPTNLSVSNCIKLKKVTTGKEMLAAVIEEINQQQIFISVAAVADYCTTNVSAQKIKKRNKPLNLELEPNPDILATVASLPKPPITIGFAAETENVIDNAFEKLQTKKVDMIIANKVGRNLVFNKDNNHLFVLRKGTKKIIELKQANKETLAKQLMPIFEELC
jgi:phosphopantothenoylcysteine decarboxylase / phosphopantothenate---cysteine ligase